MATETRKRPAENDLRSSPKRHMTSSAFLNYFEPFCSTFFDNLIYEELLEVYDNSTQNQSVLDCESTKKIRNFIKNNRTTTRSQITAAASDDTCIKLLIRKSEVSKYSFVEVKLKSKTIQFNPQIEKENTTDLGFFFSAVERFLVTLFFDSILETFLVDPKVTIFISTSFKFKPRVLWLTKAKDEPKFPRETKTEISASKEAGSNELNCVICQETIKETHSIYKLPCCSGLIHNEDFCMQYQKYSTSCPLCRSLIKIQ